MKVLEVFEFLRKKVDKQKNVIGSTNEIAEVRRQKFITEADINLHKIPLPEGSSSAIRLAEVIPDNKFKLGSLTWGVQTIQGEKFLFANRWPYGDEDRWIVLVKTRYFYAAWLASRDQPTGMCDDPPDFQNLLNKNPWSLEDESKVWTLKNPIAIPNIGSGFAERTDAHIQFVNGRHRTRWLIAKGASVIPIEVNSKEAAYALQNMMGISEHVPETILNIMNKYLVSK